MIKSFNHNGYDFFRFLRRDSGASLLFLALGVTLRGIPELLVPNYPVGYETITYYAPALMLSKGQSLSSTFQAFLKEGPLFYVLTGGIINLTGVDSFMLLKIVGPLLYGALLVSFFLFLRHGVKLEWKMAFVGTLLLGLQVAALRESWDRFRTIMSLVFSFAALVALMSDRVGQRKYLAVGALSLLAVLSREYVGLVLFAAVFGYALLDGKNRLTSFVSLVPSIAIFGAVYVPNLISAISRYNIEIAPSIRSPLWSVGDAVVIFLICYVGLLPFVFAGWRRNRLVWPMTIWLLIGSFSVLFPSLIFGYQRWLMLLVFPFCVFAVWGFERMGMFQKRRQWMLAATMLIFAVIATGYSSGTFSLVRWVPNSYVPTDLVESSIQWNNIDDVKALLEWIDRNAASNSSVLVEERFYGWAQMYLNRAREDVTIIAYSAASVPDLALETALGDGFSHIYLIWLAHTSVTNFTVVHSENAVSVFEYSPPATQHKPCPSELLELPYIVDSIERGGILV